MLLPLLSAALIREKQVSEELIARLQNIRPSAEITAFLKDYVSAGLSSYFALHYLHSCFLVGCVLGLLVYVPTLGFATFYAFGARFQFARRAFYGLTVVSPASVQLTILPLSPLLTFGGHAVGG